MRMGLLPHLLALRGPVWRREAAVEMLLERLWRGRTRRQMRAMPPFDGVPERQNRPNSSGTSRRRKVPVHETRSFVSAKPRGRLPRSWTSGHPSQPPLSHADRSSSTREPGTSELTQSQPRYDRMGKPNALFCSRLAMVPVSGQKVLNSAMKAKSKKSPIKSIVPTSSGKLVRIAGLEPARITPLPTDATRKASLRFIRRLYRVGHKNQHESPGHPK